MTRLEEFESYLKFIIETARKPLVWLETFDYGYILDTINKLINKDTVLVYNNSSRNVQRMGDDEAVSEKSSLGYFIPFFLSGVIEDKEDRGKAYDPELFKLSKILVARVSEAMCEKEGNNNIEESLIERLKDFVYYNNTLEDKACRKTILLIATNHFEVNGLEHICERITVPLPDKVDIHNELGRIRGLDEDGNKLFKYPFSTSFKVNMQKNKAELIDALYGMSLYDIKELLRTIIAESPEQDELQIVFEKKGDFEKNETLPQLIKRRKKQIVRNSGLLEVIDIEDDGCIKFHDTIADIDNLRNHIEKEKILIKNEDYQQSKLQKPRGVLLVGAPGCGKSESAKAIASILDLPIYRLDIGSLLGHKYGQSENRFIEALRTADASAPCVLWIDEIEKAFAGAGNESESDDTLTHIIGYFLTWMQEHETMVYLVATANNISKMRPEMLRTGRWDRKFYLTRPSIEGCKMILYTLLTNKYKIEFKDSEGNKIEFRPVYEANNTLHIEIENKEADEFVKNLHALSGADISSMILEALKEKYRKNEKPSNLSISDLNKFFKKSYEKSSEKEHNGRNPLERKIDAKIREIRIQHLGAKIDEEELRKLLRNELEQEFSPSKFEAEGFEPASAFPDIVHDSHDVGCGQEKEENVEDECHNSCYDTSSDSSDEYYFGSSEPMFYVP